MFIRVFVVLCFAVFALAGFSGTPGIGVEEASAAAADAAEVAETWDALCATYSFDECPADVLSGSCTTKVGDLYLGLDYATDIEGLIDAMDVELMSRIKPHPPINDDLISAVIEDPVWLD